MKQASIGFVGLGQMGLPIAGKLLQALEGEQALRVCDLRRERVAPLVAQGAKQTSLAEVGSPGGIVFTMVATEQQLLQVALSEGGILRQLGTGGVHVSLSTVSPEVSEQLAKLYHQQGNSYLICAVLGRPDVAEAGDLSLFLAGAQEAKARVRPLLAALGRHLYDLGENIDAAAITKIAFNFLIAAANEAMGEAAALVDAYGLSRKRFFRMLAESPLFTGTVFEGYGRMIGARDFSDNRFPVAYGLKDIELALNAAQRKDVPLPCADAAYEHLLAAQAAGRENEDWSVLSEFCTSRFI